MWRRLKSIRNKLLFSYLIFVITTLLTSIEIFWFNQRLSHIDLLNENFVNLQHYNLKLFKVYKDFTNNDIKKSYYFQTNNSENLVENKKTLNEIYGLLNELINDIDIKNLSIINELKEYKSNIEKFEILFDRSVNLISKRGYKDHGFEGEMRKSIRNIEQNYPEFDKISMLMLRRHEKDYIIRSDREYVDLLNKKVNYILENRLSDNEREREIKKLLISYRNNFNEMVLYDTMIKQKFDYFDNIFFVNIDKKASDLSLEAHNSLSDIQNNLNITLVVLVVANILISILLSYFLSKIITQPIVALTEQVENLVKNKFEGDFVEINHVGLDEIGILHRRFYFLLRRLQLFVSEIKSSNSKLEHQNFQLQNLNNELINANETLKVKENHIAKMNIIKDKFFVILSHDLRSPLATIKGFLNILLQHPDSVSEDLKRETLEKLSKSLELQLELLTNLLDWSSTQVDEIKFSPEKISIGIIIDKNIELLATKSNHKEIVIINDLEDNFSINADKNMVDFVIRNLLSNALKFTNPKGRILISGKQNKDEIEISISDNGVGISEKSMKYILKSGIHFSTTGTANEKGTGFGLLLCKEFIEKHGGKLKIKSSEGEGTLVSFTIPFIHQEQDNISIRKKSKKVILNS